MFEPEQIIDPSQIHILFHRSNPWHSAVRGSTGVLARQYLKAGYRVSYMQGISHIGHVLKPTNRFVSRPYFDSKCWIFTPLSLIPFGRSGWFSTRAAADLSYRLCYPSIKSLLNQGTYGSPQVIWTARPGSSVLRKIFPDALIFFQVVDYYPAFGGPHTVAIEQQDYNQADHIFSIGYALTEYLVNELRIAPEKITTLGQGVALEHYTSGYTEPSELRNLSRPRAIWVGVLNKADAELFNAASQELDRIGGSLILIGPISQWARALAKRYSHVHLLGTRQPEDIPAYLRSCDIGLMLYSRASQKIYRGQNPLKLYEYAAAKLVIISTPHEEYRFQEPPALIVDNPGEVQAALRAAIADPIYWKSRATEFISDKSWNRNFKNSETVIKRMLEQHLHLSRGP